MGSDYKNWYLKDLIPIIEHVAMDLMSDPVMGGKKADGTIMTLTEIANQNSLIAMNNAGIRQMASTLIITLAKDGETE